MQLSLSKIPRRQDRINPTLKNSEIYLNRLRKLIKIAIKTLNYVTIPKLTLLHWFLCHLKQFDMEFVQFPFFQTNFKKKFLTMNY